MKRFFITATGTDIGKTFLAAGLMREFRARGLTVEGRKPVVSGFTDENAATSDPGLLLQAAGRAPIVEEIVHISPWRFAAPLSPDMAARREGRAIDFEELLAFSRAPSAAVVLIVEGVGGIMVPLDDTHTTLDWMAALNFPVILVAGSYLGTISHTLSALDVLTRRNLRPAVLAMSESIDAPASADETLQSILAISGSIDTAILPRTPADHAKAFARLADLLLEAG